MTKTIEIPEGYEARIEGNKVILEPKESGDERIRKEIIEFINWAESRGSVRNDWLQKKCPVNWIAYLEKQKEQKPISQEDFDTAKHEALWGEQKPRKFKLGDKVHWYDDNTNVSTIIGFRDDAYLTDSAYGLILYCDEDYWERVEQKPAEWSEEDENAIKNICDYILGHTNFAERAKYEAVDFLKLLCFRRSWKPSKEQMDALISKLPIINGTGDKVDSILESLYNDLKKL